MKDVKYIIGFTVLGLLLAYAVSSPLRQPVDQEPRVGTPLRSAADSVYAEGTISIQRELASKAANTAALFIIARSFEGGPPIAVQRHALPSFPFRFSLTVKDSMLGNEFFKGPVRIIARLDSDGSAGPPQKGDLEGSVEILEGQPRKVSITIDKPSI